jgi:2-dehydro-3-deoxygluconokinase
VADLAAVAGPEVVTLGECLVSFVAADLGPLAGSPTFHAYAAGAEANVAVGLARRSSAASAVTDSGRGSSGRSAARVSTSAASPSTRRARPG